LRPDELGRLTLSEFIDMVKGYQWREKNTMQKLAQLASWVTAPHLKKPVDPKKLLETKQEKRKRTTQAESNAVVNDLMAQMNVGGGAIYGNNSGNVR
jgi:dipeptidase